MGEIKKGEVEIMKFKRIVAIVLSVTTLLSNVTQTSFADEISEAEQDKNESIRQDSVANQTTELNEPTSINQEYVTNQNTEPNEAVNLNQDHIANQNTETTEIEGIGQDINKNEAPEKNKVETTIPINFTAELEKLEKNSEGGYLDYMKATKLAIKSIESGEKDHVILEKMGSTGDKNLYWFSYKDLNRIIPLMKEKCFKPVDQQIIKKIEEFVSQNDPEQREAKIKELIQQNDNNSKPINSTFDMSLFSAIGATVGYGLGSFLNFVKNKVEAINTPSNTKEQLGKKNLDKANTKGTYPNF